MTLVVLSKLLIAVVPLLGLCRSSLRGVASGNGTAGALRLPKEIAGVPIYNNGLSSSTIAASDNQMDVMLVLKEASDNQVKTLCEVIHCTAWGHPEEGGLAFLSLSVTSAELEAILTEYSHLLSFAELDAPTYAIPDSPSETLSASLPWGLDRVDDRQGVDGSYDVAADGGNGVHVYVADTGIRTTHSDFGSRAIPTLEVLGPVVECDASNTDCAKDNQGHGTHCAGTIGGTVHGIAKGATLHAVKVLSDSGSGQWSWLVSALDWVATQGQRPAVFSASLGGGGNLQTVEVAVDAATNAGVTVVVAAGNSNSDACGFSPAFVSSAITVGATTQSDERASFSNYGSCLDIFAPGVGILSTGHGSDSATAIMSGTSMACPHVAGAAALLLQANANLSPAEVSAALKARATFGMISDLQQGSPDELLYVGNGSPMTSTTTTSTTPDFGGAMWVVTQGPCTIDSESCLLSPNHPQNYGDNENCAISVNAATAGPIEVKSFDTEGNSDTLKVNGQAYSGASGPDGVTPSGAIEWSSDSSVVKAGWRLCPPGGATPCTPLPWSTLSNQFCDTDLRTVWDARTIEPLASCKASCEADSSCPGISVGAYGGVSDVCLKCTSVASTRTLSGWATHVKPTAWSALINQYCNTNWRTVWDARTVESLASCKASCEADSNCPGISVGAYGGVSDICTKCSNVASTTTYVGFTTHVKSAQTACTTTTITSTSTIAATTTTTTLPTTTRTTTTTTTVPGSTTTTTTTTTLDLGGLLSQMQNVLLDMLSGMQTQLTNLQAQMGAISSHFNISAQLGVIGSQFNISASD